MSALLIKKISSPESDLRRLVIHIETDVEGPPIGKKLVSGINSAAKLKELPGGDIREKLREQVWEKRKTKKSKEEIASKGKGSVVYKKDNVTIKQLDLSTAPNETLGSTDVYTFFDITITKEVEKDTFYVKADFEEETLTPGDTVKVIMKKLDKDGNEFDFDPETYFEVGMEYGCGIAYILNAEGEKTDYVPGMKGPIEVIIEEDIEIDNPLIRLFVGVEDDNENDYKPYSDYLALQPKPVPGDGEAKKSSKLLLESLENSICGPPPEPQNDGIDQIEGIIEDINCDDEDFACGEGYINNTPTFKVKILEQNSYKGKDLCNRYGDGEFIPMKDGEFRIGYGSGNATTPLKDEFLLPYEIDACYNASAYDGEGAWQYKILSEEDENKFILQAIIRLCLDGDWIKLENKSALYNIKDELLCQALIDFEYDRPYRFGWTDYPTFENFLIKKSIREHEYVHKKRYEKLVIEKSLQMNYYGYNEIITFEEAFNFQPVCSKLTKDDTKAISLARNHYEKILKDFISTLNEVHRELKGNCDEDASDEERWACQDNENYTQWHSDVQNIITDYQEKILEIATNRGISLDCAYKQDWSEFEKYKNSLK